MWLPVDMSDGDGKLTSLQRSRAVSFLPLLSLGPAFALRKGSPVQSSCDGFQLCAKGGQCRNSAHFASANISLLSNLLFIILI